MKTYRADEIKKIFKAAVDPKQYARFTVFYGKTQFGKKVFGGRPLKVKAKFSQAWCDKKGIKLEFSNVYFNRKKLPFRANFWLCDIRWIYLPANMEILSQFFTNRLLAGQRRGADTLPTTANNK